MPRAPQYYHPFQTIRLVISQCDGRKAGTQDGFAKLLGEERSAVTIKKIEDGSLKLSRRIAFLVTAATGVDTAPILRGSLDEPKTLDGTDFNERSYREWTAGLVKGHAIDFAEGIGRELLDLFSATYELRDSAALRRMFCEFADLIATCWDGLPTPDQFKKSNSPNKGANADGILALLNENRIRYQKLSFQEIFAPRAKMNETEKSTTSRVQRKSQRNLIK